MQILASLLIAFVFARQPGGAVMAQGPGGAPAAGGIPPPYVCSSAANGTWAGEVQTGAMEFVRGSFFAVRNCALFRYGTDNATINWVAGPAAEGGTAGSCLPLTTRPAETVSRAPMFSQFVTGSFFSRPVATIFIADYGTIRPYSLADRTVKGIFGIWGRPVDVGRDGASTEATFGLTLRFVSLPQTTTATKIGVLDIEWNCVRVLTIGEQTVKTFAGVCGSAVVPSAGATSAPTTMSFRGTLISGASTSPAFTIAYIADSVGLWRITASAASPLTQGQTGPDVSNLGSAIGLAGLSLEGGTALFAVYSSPREAESCVLGVLYGSSQKNLELSADVMLGNPIEVTNIVDGVNVRSLRCPGLNAGQAALETFVSGSAVAVSLSRSAFRLQCEAFVDGASTPTGIDSNSNAAGRPPGATSNGASAAPNSGPSDGAIAGIAVGIAVTIVVIAVIAGLVLRHQLQKQHEVELLQHQQQAAATAAASTRDGSSSHLFGDHQQPIDNHLTVGFASTTGHSNSADDRLVQSATALFAHGNFTVPADPRSPALSSSGAPDLRAIHEARCHMVARGDLQKGRLLGRGANGSVYSCMLADGSSIAVKTTQLTGDEGTMKEQARQCLKEVEMQTALLHPNTVEVYGVRIDRKEMAVEVYMEQLSGGSIGSLVRGLQDRLNETVARNYAAQIVDGLA